MARCRRCACAFTMGDSFGASSRPCQMALCSRCHGPILPVAAAWRGAWAWSAPAGNGVRATGVGRPAAGGGAPGRPRLPGGPSAVVGPAQAIHAGHQGGGSGELGVTRHWTTYARRASHAPTPMDRHIALCLVLVDIDGDAIHPPTHALLAVLRGRSRSGLPDWHVV